MYITKQSPLLLSLPLFGQEYITKESPQVVVQVGLFLERFSRQLGRFRKQHLFRSKSIGEITQDPRFTSELLLSNMACRHGGQLLKKKLKSVPV